MHKELVSIITPCYNTGETIHRLLDSILFQDYPNIEVIAINDGSLDNTEEVILSYQSKFEDKGYTLQYLCQENLGQSSAVNRALKEVKGEYLCWPDSDDYYRSSNAISTFVNTLSEIGKEYGVVRCIPTFIDENTFIETRTERVTEELLNPMQFNNCLYSQNFIWVPGNYMIRMACFDECVPKREIYHEKNAGQNFQMLLPILYTYRCKTLSDSLFCVLERATSHSRGQSHSYEKQRRKFLSYDRSVIETLTSIPQIPLSEKKEFIRQFRNRSSKRELELAIRYKKREDAIIWRKHVKQNNLKLQGKLLLKYWLLVLFNK